jgi:hypothetical protein
VSLLSLPLIAKLFTSSRGKVESFTHFTEVSLVCHPHQRADSLGKSFSVCFPFPLPRLTHREKLFSLLLFTFFFLFFNGKSFPLAHALFAFSSPLLSSGR